MGFHRRQAGDRINPYKKEFIYRWFQVKQVEHSERVPDGTFIKGKKRGKAEEHYVALDTLSVGKAPRDEPSRFQGSP